MSAVTVEGRPLLAFIERYERLDEDAKAIAEDKKEVLAEAKGQGYDVKIIRKILARRKMDVDRLREEEEIMDLYLSALGMLADTPLGRSAMQREFSGIGRAVPLTAEEEADGVTAAFLSRDGTRSSVKLADAVADVAKKADRRRKKIDGADAPGSYAGA